MFENLTKQNRKYGLMVLQTQIPTTYPQVILTMSFPAMSLQTFSINKIILVFIKFWYEFHRQV